jgi:aminopeptidase-like protein
LAVDICGNDGQLVLQKSLKEHKINDIAHLAIFSLGKDYKFGKFRATIGSDEYAFNDPLIGVPGILLTRYPYKEYHNADDTPDKINYEKIEETGKVIQKIVEYWEKDFVPRRNFKAPLRRSKYDIQSSNPQLNLSWDYFFYDMDGEKSLAELCTLYGIDFEQALKVVNQMIEKHDCSINFIKRGKQKTSKQK